MCLHIIDLILACIVLVFSDLNKAQIYKKPYRDSPYHENEILMSFNYINLFEPNKHTEGRHIREPNVRNFLLEIEDKISIYIGENLISVETKEKIVNYSSDLCLNDIKYAFAYSEENFYLMLHRKYIPIQEYATSKKKDESHYFYEKDDETKGDNNTDEDEGITVDGNDFINCKNITA